MAFEGTLSELGLPVATGTKRNIIDFLSGISAPTPDITQVALPIPVQQTEIGASPKRQTAGEIKVPVKEFGVGATVENPEFYEQDEATQGLARTLYQQFGHDRVLQEGLEPPEIPYGSTSGFLRNMFRGALGQEKEQTLGASDKATSAGYGIGFIAPFFVGGELTPKGDWSAFAHGVSRVPSKSLRQMLRETPLLDQMEREVAIRTRPNEFAVERPQIGKKQFIEREAKDYGIEYRGEQEIIRKGDKTKTIVKQLDFYDPVTKGNFLIDRIEELKPRISKLREDFYRGGKIGAEHLIQTTFTPEQKATLRTLSPFVNKEQSVNQGLSDLVDPAIPAFGKNRDEMLAFFGYTPELAESLQKAWAGKVDKVWDKALGIIPQRIQQTFRTIFSTPAPSEAKAILNELERQKLQGKIMADELARSIKQIPEEYQMDVFNALDPTALGTGEAPTFMKIPSQYHDIIHQARTSIDQLGAEAVGLGLLDEKTYYANVGQYLGRFYNKYEAKKELGRRLAQLFGKKKIVGERFKGRVLQTPEERVQAGIITDPSYALSRTIGDLTFDVETAKTFKRIADNPAWTQPIERFSSPDEALAAGFSPMPTDKKFGALSGKYVENGIYDEINSLYPKTGKGKFGRAFDEVQDFYDSFLGLWKAGKTVFSPAAHGRNIFSNTILADIGGLSFTNVPTYARALKDYATKGRYYQEALSAGLYGTDWFGAELKPVLGSFSKTKRDTMFGAIADLISDSKLGKVFGSAGKLYQAEEHWFKTASFMDRRLKGDDILTAAAHAQKHLFDYSDLSPFLKWLRRTPAGGPFLTFTAKALPLMAEVAVKHPVRFWKWPLMFAGVNKMSRHAIGMDDQQYDIMQESLPDWQKNTLLSPKILLPIKDGQGRPMIIDLSYNLPWGSISGQGNLLKNLPFTKNLPTELIDPFIGGNPVFRTPFEILWNKDLFRNKEIFDPNLDQYIPGRYTSPAFGGQATENILKHIGRTLSPGILPAISSVSDALQEKPSRSGEVPDKLATILNKLAGIKTVDVDFDRNMFYRGIALKKMAEAVRGRAVQIASDQSISQEEKNRQYEILKARAGELQQQYDSLATANKKFKFKRKK